MNYLLAKGMLTCRPKRQCVAWPTPRFTDNNNGTVTDNLTGLIWTKNSQVKDERTWEQALSDANGLAAGAAGLLDASKAGDWGLPNIREFLSLVNYSRSPALPEGHWGSSPTGRRLTPR